MAQIVTMPKLGDMLEGTLARWIIAEGDSVTEGQVLAEIETDKATVEVVSAYPGVVHRHLVSEGAVIPVGSPIAVIGEPGEEIDLGELLTGFAAKEVKPQETESSPELKFELGEPFPTPKPELTPLKAPPPEVSVPLSRLRTTIWQRTTLAKQQVPHFYLTYEYNVAPLMELRQQMNAQLEDAGEKLSINDFLLKAVALTLRQFPNLNASFQEGQITHHRAINIGIAVAVKGGLLTVVNRNTDQKPLRQISSEVRAAIQRARESKVRPEDLEGSTFSVSNLGMYNVENFIAIINPPEAAVLAVGAVRQVPIAEGETVKIGTRMKATLSIDHRVSDGAEAAKFMQALQAYFEQPQQLLA